MNYADMPESLEKLITPVIICDEGGQVIYKNTAAVRSVRLPRRNTSMLTHLGQTEQGELARLSERKKPSVLTVQTGDRNARALVMYYLRQSKPCSLWVFASLLQTGAVSGMFAEQDSMLSSIGRDICEYVKAVDEFSLALPTFPTHAQLDRVEKHLRRIIDELIGSKRGWLFELSDSLEMLEDSIERPLRKYGYTLKFHVDFEHAPSWAGRKGDTRLLIDLQAFYTLYLHLILFCCDCAPMRHIDAAVCKDGEEYCMEVAFTLPYPPFYTDEESNDLSALIELSPKNRFEIMLFEAYAVSHGFEMSYRITHEVDNNMRLRMKLPLLRKLRLRSGEEGSAEKLFVQHDLALYFWHVVKERFMGRDE